MADHTNTVDYRSPVYLQMRELIRSRIAEGIYQPGGSIPSENELAAEFDPPVSKSCLNHRLRKLLELSRDLSE